MNKARRAIIMAAGIGQRMNPITLKIPKPLIVINGKKMIETIIDALYKNEIDEIYIVVGYLKEKFEEIQKKYPNVQLIENPYYYSCNNISSLFMAREYIEDSIIMDGDQIIYNSNILNLEFEKSGYCCMWSEDETDEWLLTIENDKIIHCNRNGGKRGWQLLSVSFWTREDGKRLKKHLENIFLIQKKHDIYWDDVPLFCYPEQYELGVRKIQKTDLIEIDSLDELICLESSYVNILK